jgi:UPF0716 family protein affecting phage T7 exclusion
MKSFAKETLGIVAACAILVSILVASRLADGADPGTMLIDGLRLMIGAFAFILIAAVKAVYKSIRP